MDPIEAEFLIEITNMLMGKSVEPSQQKINNSITNLGNSAKTHFQSQTKTVLESYRPAGPHPYHVSCAGFFLA